MALVSLGLCWPSYLLSETSFGSTGNAAEDRLAWVMSEILPAGSGLSIGGIFYRYTLSDKPADETTVVKVRNRDLINGGFVFEEVDTWELGTGGTIQKNVALPEYVPRKFWGRGEIAKEGEGTISDTTVRYFFKFDSCFEVRDNPECPDFDTSLLQFVLDNLPEDPEIDDGLSDEAEDVLNSKTEVDEEDDKRKEEDNELDADEEKRRKLASDNKLMIDAAAQSQLFDSLALIPNFESYYTVEIQGGQYTDTVTIQDKTLPDNRRAMRNLANDTAHTEMVRSQYR